MNVAFALPVDSCFGRKLMTMGMEEENASLYCILESSVIHN